VNLNTGDVRIVGSRRGRSWRGAGWPWERPTEPWQANMRSSGSDRAGTLLLTTTRPRAERVVGAAAPDGAAGSGCGVWSRRSSPPGVAPKGRGGAVDHRRQGSGRSAPGWALNSARWRRSMSNGDDTGGWRWPPCPSRPAWAGCSRPRWRTGRGRNRRPQATGATGINRRARNARALLNHRCRAAAA